VGYFLARLSIGVRGGVVAEQATGAVEETGDTGSVAHGSTGSLAHGTEQVPEHNPGRPASWVAISVIVVGFLVGIPAMVPHMRWWLFWIGVGIVVVGVIATAAVKTTSEDWY
jgi:hypothetical protein